jgi:hypothetical protein
MEIVTWAVPTTVQYVHLQVHVQFVSVAIRLILKEFVCHVYPIVEFVQEMLKESVYNVA